MASQKEDGAFHSKKNEESTPPSSVKEAVSKGLMKADAIQSTYDNMAEEYLEIIKADESNEDAIGPTHVALKKLCRHIFDLHVENGLLMDVGCGPGTNLLWLAKQEEFARIDPPPALVGVDLSPEMIKLAKKESQNDTNVEFRVGNMLQLDFDESSAVGMLNGCCIQHADLHGVKKTLSEAARVLMPGGIFVLQFWIGDDAPLPGPEGAAFIGWKLDTVRSAIQDADNGLVLFDESQHVYEAFDMPYAFFYIRKT
jgi:SAM-dependent methyltransferase